MCTLILTEGDSAKSLAISGLSIVGRDHYGVFPLRCGLQHVWRGLWECVWMDGLSVSTASLMPGGVCVCRGKLLNVREANAAQISANVEIQNIKQILGLQHGKVWRDIGGPGCDFSTNQGGSRFPPPS